VNYSEAVEVLHLLAAPLEVRGQDEAGVEVRVLEDDPLYLETVS
jgi:hypothetical protein